MNNKNVIVTSMEDEAKDHVQTICDLFDSSDNIGSFEDKLAEHGIPDKDALAALFGLAKTDEHFIDRLMR